MNRRRFAMLSLAVLTTAPAIAAEPGPPVRVLSFNLRQENPGDKDTRSWTARRDLAAQLVKQDQPDLIGYQEAFRSMLDDMAARISGYEEIGVGREDGKTKGEYSAIWVKKDRFMVQESGTFWLSDTPDVPNSMSWGNKITRICTWARLLDKSSNQVVHFYNTHLDHQSQEARLKGTQQILAHLAARSADGPFVLTGDFNAGESNPAIASVVKANPLQAVDSWRELHPDVPAAESGTFHSFTGTAKEDKIDYIFVPRSAKLIDAAIMHDNKDGVYPSDHFPIRATVAFASAPAGPAK